MVCDITYMEMKKTEFGSLFYRKFHILSFMQSANFTVLWNSCYDFFGLKHTAVREQGL